MLTIALNGRSHPISISEPDLGRGTRVALGSTAFGPTISLSAFSAPGSNLFLGQNPAPDAVSLKRTVERHDTPEPAAFIGSIKPSLGW